MTAKQLPTDAEILGVIYDHYKNAFVHGEADRRSKIFVPIDIEAMARALTEDPFILFGRLYHDLDGRYGYTKASSRGSTERVALFTPYASGDKDCVNFPMLAGVLARLQDERHRQRSANRNSVIALCIAAASFGATVATLILRFFGNGGQP